MKNLFRVLPAFAPDYSGISAALFEMDALTVFYDAHGCNGQTLYYTEPRYQNFASLPKSFSFSISEREAILGADKYLVEKIRRALDWVEASYIVLVGTPVPMLMGVDFPALERTVEQATGLPTIALPSNGLHFYDQGEASLWTRLIDKFALPPMPSGGSLRINLIGATPLDQWDRGQISAYIAWLHTCGAESVSCWGVTDDLDAIRNAADACLNLAVSYGGLQACKKLYQKFGTPYLIGYPVGAQAAEVYRDVVQRCLNGESSALPPWQAPQANPHGKRALILGDQINQVSIARCLYGEFGFQNIVCASYFSLDKTLSRPNDVHLRSEEDLIHCLASTSYDLVVADPIYKPLIPDTVSQFCPFPHMATSGLLHWKDGVTLFAEKGSAYLRQYIR